MAESHQPGGRERLADAYRAQAGVLYRYALVVTGRRVMAEDAMQQAFAKLAAQGERIGQIEDLGRYLRTAVRNECYRLLQGPRAAEMEDEPPILVPVDAALTSEEQRRAVEGALAALPAEQREVVHLKVYESMTFQQIAELLGIPANTAASRYRYAMERLREKLLQKDEV